MTINVEAQQAISRFTFTDALVMPGTVERFMNNIQEFMAADPALTERREQAVRLQVEQTYYNGPRADGPQKPFIFRDGVAVIPIHGVLINRFSSCWGFVTGYSYIRSMLRAALADDDVKLIAYDVDSPGGDAPGCFELAEEIRASRELKPSIAVVDAVCASAAYALGSAATKMVCTPSGSVGSVGVYWIHADLSKMHAQIGVEFTIYEAPEDGAKMDGSPYGPMSERAAKEAQERVQKRYEEFVALVVANRDLSEEAVVGTQARMYRADEAMDKSLIDRVSTPSEAVADFLGELASDDPPLDETEELNMALPKDQAELDRMLEQARTQAASEAVTAEQTRRKDLMALPEASTRPKMAATLADSGMDVATAKVALAAAPEETVSQPQEQQQGQQQTQQQQRQQDGQQQQGNTAPTGQQQQTQQPSHFMNAMDQGGGAGVGSQGGNQPEQQQQTDDDKALAILGDQAALTGHDLRPKQQQQQQR